ncbi:hypothetical protein [Rhodococcus triatomae]
MHTDPGSPYRWIIRCSHCDHQLHAAGDRATAEAFARTNGWVTTTPVQCPGCATTSARRLPAENSDGPPGAEVHRSTAA